MDALEAIRTRRSIRRFKPKKVPEAALRKCLEAAMAAPSAGNQQPWQFVVLDDRALLDQVPSVHPHCSMIKEAPVAVLVCGDLNREKYPGFWVQDCSAAVQNLLLAAHAQGLGAVWTGLHPSQERVDGVRRLLGLPGNVVPLALVPLGWPAEQPAPADRFDETRVRRNRWGD